MFYEAENSGKKMNSAGRKMSMSQKEDIKLLHSLDFSYFVFCSITEEILQPHRHMIK